MQAIVESVRLMPHPSNPQDILISWHVLKALPFSLVFASQHLDQQLTHARTHRQPLMLASADAKAELVDSLGRLEDDARTDGIVAAAVRTCLSAAANDLKVGCDPFVLYLSAVLLSEAHGQQSKLLPYMSGCLNPVRMHEQAATHKAYAYEQGSAS